MPGVETPLSLRDRPEHQIVLDYCATRTQVQQLDSKIKSLTEGPASDSSTTHGLEDGEDIDLLKLELAQGTAKLRQYEEELFEHRLVPTARRLVRLHVFGHDAFPRNMQNLDRQSFCDDAEGEVFMNLTKGICKFKGNATLRTWVNTIVINTILALIRKCTGRGKNKPIFESIDKPDPDDPQRTVSEASSKEVVGNPATNVEQTIAIQQVFDSYAERSNSHLLSLSVMRLRQEGYTAKEISQMVGKTPGAVDKIHSRDIIDHRSHFRELGIIPGLSWRS